MRCKHLMKDRINVFVDEYVREKCSACGKFKIPEMTKLTTILLAVSIMTVLILDSVTPAIGETQEFRVFIILVGDSCNYIDFYRTTLSNEEYAFTCVGSSGGDPNSTFIPSIMADYLWLRDFGYNVMFVVDNTEMLPKRDLGVDTADMDLPPDHRWINGLANPSKDYGFAYRYASTIEHEIEHLRCECTVHATGFHDMLEELL